MSEAPLVTVITPSFNQARFLEGTILSVLGQEYPALEYLVIDGGSHDGSVEIIRKYESRLAYWVSEKDSGQAEAINKGLSRARGRYVAWLNSDDLYLPGALSAAVEAFARAPDASLVYANGLGIDAEGNITERPKYRPYTLLDLLSMQMIHQPTVLMRRDMVQAVGGVDQSYHLLLDHHLWVRLVQCAPLYFVDSYWAAARRHSEAKNTVQRLRFPEEARRILKECAQSQTARPLLQTKGRAIEAGLRRFEAIYLLADGQGLSALERFASAALLDPRGVRRAWRPMLLSAARGLGLSRAEAWLYFSRACWTKNRYAGGAVQVGADSCGRRETLAVQNEEGVLGRHPRDGAASRGRESGDG